MIYIQNTYLQPNKMKKKNPKQNTVLSLRENDTLVWMNFNWRLALHAENLHTVSAPRFLLHLHSCMVIIRYSPQILHVYFSRFIILQHLLSWYALGTWKSKSDIICDWYVDILCADWLPRKTLSNAKHIIHLVMKSEGLCRGYHGDIVDLKGVGNRKWKT